MKPLIATLCVAVLLGLVTTVSAQPPQNLGFWLWHTQIVDPVNNTANLRCKAAYHNFLAGNSSSTPGLALGLNGTMFLFSNSMFMCQDDASVRQLSNLGSFMNEMATIYNVTVDLLFSQSKTDPSTEAAYAWLHSVVPFVQQRIKEGYKAPALRFDIEFNTNSEDAERVLRIAYDVRRYLKYHFSPEDMPELSWSVASEAAMSSLHWTTITCPVSWQRQRRMLIADCFAVLVDTITLMDYRSYAVQEAAPYDHCDGMTVMAAPFFDIARQHNIRISVGAETSCDLDTPFQYKISYCASSQAWHTSNGLGYMYSSLNATQVYLTNTSAAIADYPCAATELKPGQTLWTESTIGTPAFVIEDASSWEALAYASPDDAQPVGELMADACDYVNRTAWQSCDIPSINVTSMMLLVDSS